MTQRLAYKVLLESPRPLSWRDDTHGAAAVEFALLLPVLVALYLGGFETLRLVSSYRKVCDTTAELANIAAQSSPITASEVQTDMGAAAQIMSPYPTSGLTIVTTEITTNASSAATVTWSQGWKAGAAYPAAANTKGASWTLPAALAVPSTSYILVQTNFTYTSLLGAGYIGATIPVANQLYMSPRTVTTISCPDC